MHRRPSSGTRRRTVLLCGCAHHPAQGMARSSFAGIAVLLWLISDASGQTSCVDVTDVAFVVDGSGSICDNDPNFVFARDYTCQNWEFIVQFIYRIVDTFNIGPTQTRVALIIFASDARLLWGLDAYSDKAALLYAIETLQYQKGGTTDTTGGLNMVNTQVFNTPADRPNAPNMAIIITDGKPTVYSTVPAAIASVHSNNIETFAIGVTDSVDMEMLELLSSLPQQHNVTYFIASEYSTIDNVRNILQSQTCGPTS